jgi:hypothetical protein
MVDVLVSLVEVRFGGEALQYSRALKLFPAFLWRSDGLLSLNVPKVYIVVAHHRVDLLLGVHFSG